MSSSKVLQQLIREFKGICHYCEVKVDRSLPERHPTREHIVPKGLGGPDDIYNLLLSCSGCNNDRGTQLFYCCCPLCLEVIEYTLYEDADALDDMFMGIINHNKPRISIDMDKDKKFWVRVGHQQRSYSTYEGALQFALKVGSYVKKKNYKEI